MVRYALYWAVSAGFIFWEPVTFELGKPTSRRSTEGVRQTNQTGSQGTEQIDQGSAADQTKKAMLDCYEGLIPMLTVHDELCFNIENDEQIGRIKEIMETGVPLKVPSKIDVDIKPDWGGSRMIEPDMKTLGIRQMHPVQVEALMDFVGWTINLASIVGDEDLLNETEGMADELVRMFGGKGR